jgi:hypothetical protein
MKISTDFKITATIEITNTEAEVILHLTDYNLLKYFESSVSTKFSAEQMKLAIEQLRTVCRKVSEAHDRAVKAAKEQ